jgi:hypothetical protein
MRKCRCSVSFLGNIFLLTMPIKNAKSLHEANKIVAANMVNIGMMKRIAGFALNALIVITCVITCINFGRTWFSSAPNRTDIAQPPVGTRLEVAGQDWNKAPATLVLVISPKCHYCEASVPFYKSVVTSAAAAGVGLVALSPTSEEETRRWLSISGLAISAVRPLGASGVFHAFPTVSLVDGRGVVQKTWVGGLALNQQKEVMSAIARAHNRAGRG